MEIYFDGFGCHDRTRPPKGVVVVGATDREGNWPKRTKRSHPYSYDPICQYLNSSVKANGSAYHDRMQQWDYEKYNRVVKTHCKQGNSFSNGRIVEAMLRDYFDDPSLKLACIVEYCNASSGYACFRFDFFQEKSST